MSSVLHSLGSGVKFAVTIGAVARAFAVLEYFLIHVLPQSVLTYIFKESVDVASYIAYATLKVIDTGATRVLKSIGEDSSEAYALGNIRPRARNEEDELPNPPAPV